MIRVENLESFLSLTVAGIMIFLSVFDSFGTVGSDDLTGTDADDKIDGVGGEDIIDGSFGTDILYVFDNEQSITVHSLMV